MLFSFPAFPAVIMREKDDFIFRVVAMAMQTATHRVREAFFSLRYAH